MIYNKRLFVDIKQKFILNVSACWVSFHLVVQAVGSKSKTEKWGGGDAGM